MPIWVPPTKQKKNEQQITSINTKTKGIRLTLYHQNKYNTRKH